LKNRNFFHQRSQRINNRYFHFQEGTTMNRIFTFRLGLSRAIAAGVCSVVFAVSLSAQVTSVKLPTADSSASFQVQDSGNVLKLRVNGDGGFVAGGTYGRGTIPAIDAGVRMMWYPAKVAFRAGHVTGSEWDDANIGDYSTALGLNTTASGNWSTAMGSSTRASGLYSTAMGDYTTASGNRSTAMGNSTMASGLYSTAMGDYTTASGNRSTAMGNSTTASGFVSTAMGYSTMASGIASIAMGWYDTASGDYSTAIGSHVSTNDMMGSFIIGDASTTTTYSAAANRMTMRFANGYFLFSNAAASVGVCLLPGGSSWMALSDSTKKTNFVTADHDYFLSSLSKLKLGSWNYKSQDAKNYRHYGPMAQEIYHFFGHDGKGTIGCDTLLATADMDGIMMVCLQALEKRTTALNSALEELKTEKEKVASIEKQNNERDKTIASLTDKIEKLSQLVYSSPTKNRDQLTLNTSKEESR
jgi:hypothetical protein